MRFAQAAPLRFRHTYHSLLDETAAQVGVQQKFMRHRNAAATKNVCGNASLRQAEGKLKGRTNGESATKTSEKLYTPSEVAALLNVSYDTAVRSMQNMKGCVDMGTQTKRYERGKKLLRINGKHLVAYLISKTRDSQ